MVFLNPTRWSAEELAIAAQRAREEFSASRRTEGLDFYLESFGEVFGRVSDLMDQTDNLLRFTDVGSELLVAGRIDEIRYLASPVISEDDLKTLCDVRTLSGSALSRNPGGCDRIVELILECLDPKRFPWVAEDRDPTPEEIGTALVATTVMMASQETQTNRRKIAQDRQEGGVANFLTGMGYHEVPRRPILTVANAPQSGEFCRECQVSGKKADIVIGMADGRFMALECKVSNSEVNSFKRLNHETVEKVTHWNAAFGTNGVVGAAVLAGVFKVANLMAAQDEGVSIFWSSDLSSLGEFLRKVEETATA